MLILLAALGIGFVIGFIMCYFMDKVNADDTIDWD